MWFRGRFISRVVLVVAIPLLAVAVVAGLYLIDRARHSGRVPRNVTLDGAPIGGVPFDELEHRLAADADAYARRPIRIALGDQEIVATAESYGYALDVGATLAAVAALEPDGGVWVQFTDWWDRLWTPIGAGTRFTFAPEIARTALEREASARHEAPREPSIESDEAGLVLDPGEAGRTLDVDGTLAAMDLPTVPQRLEGVWKPLAPAVSRGEAISLFTGLKRRTETGLILLGTGIQRFVEPERFAGWISARSVGGALVVSFDEEEIYRHIEHEFFGYVQGELRPTYDIVDGRPVPIAIEDTRHLCCDPAVVDAVVAIALGERDGPIEIPLRPTTVDEQARDLEALGVREVTGEFTTFHRCCESRVTNIHRIADLTRGVVIEPGGVFSVNGFVGRRTTANGFVDGGVIYQGRFESDVGGGISQYATTLFNAAFFAGLDFIDYQSHSIYLSRYPYGREATLSYPEPDLILRNPGPYAVLIWPTYDETSITVTLYSTPTSAVTQTDQVVDRWRSCTRVTTHRQREFEDGRVVEDFVFALYRPSAGYSCDGLAEPPPPGDGGDDEAGT